MASCRSMVCRRAKIVCTVGPAVDAPDAIERLVEAGMDVARLNFSHGTTAEHAERAERIRAASARRQKPVALLQDLGGPKVRTAGNFPAQLATGAEVDVVSGASGDGATIAIDYETLSEDVEPGDPILLGDGHVELSVLSVERGRVRCRVEHGGALRPRMGVNLPSQRVKLRALTNKDRSDLAAGLELGVDYVALSFVRRAEDIQELRTLCEERGRPTPIVAKIETPGAVEHLDSIVRAADAIMVARGDLGVELAPERVPVIQREILDACRRYQKPAIVATEMLHSMVDSPRPTRAEASDVAGAVFGGADAVMLSGETATGRYPVEACAMMDRIIRDAEASAFFEPKPAERGDSAAEAVARAACRIADEVGATVIVALTESGTTARLVSKARPRVDVLALSPDAATLRRLALVWGVTPSSFGVITEVDELVRRVGSHLSEFGWARPGTRWVLVYGAPFGARGSTNAVRVEELSA